MMRQHLEHFMQYPGMYVGYPEFERIVDYLHGLDDGTNGSVLIGFQEWLSVLMGYHGNSGWGGHVVQHALKVYEKQDLKTGFAEDDELLVQHLFKLLREYLQARHENDGLKRIFVRYQRMLEASDIYDPDLDGVE